MKLEKQDQQDLQEPMVPPDPLDHKVLRVFLERAENLVNGETKVILV